MGNPVRIHGQSAVGSINRVSSLVPFLKRRDGTEKFKIFCYTFNVLDGLMEIRLPELLRGRRRTKFHVEDGISKLVELNYKPTYDMIVRGSRVYFCIQAARNYFLYDDDFGNPINADITLKNGKSFVIDSNTEANTLQIIKSLPEEAVVYSLKVTNGGLVRGNANMRKFNLVAARKAFEVMRLEKTADKTRSNIIKRTTQQKKIERLKGL
jgi:hypothetical protein